MRYISLDIGTTNVKGIIYDEFGRVVETTDRKSTLNQPQPAFREQEASERITAVPISSRVCAITSVLTLLNARTKPVTSTTSGETTGSTESSRCFCFMK